MDVSQRRELTQQLDRAHGSYELVLSPVILGLLGWLADGWLGTRPVITVIAAVVGLAGAVTKIVLGYDAEMQAHAEEAPWAR